MGDGSLNSQGVMDGEHGPAKGVRESREDVLDEWGRVHGLRGQRGWWFRWKRRGPKPWEKMGVITMQGDGNEGKKERKGWMRARYIVNQHYV